MPHRNGHKKVESPRPEVRKAFDEAGPASIEAVQKASDAFGDLVRKHPLASLVFGGLAGIGAVICIKKLLR